MHQSSDQLFNPVCISQVCPKPPPSLSPSQSFTEMVAAKDLFLLPLPLLLLLQCAAATALQAPDHSYPDLNEQQVDRRTVIVSSTRPHTTRSTHVVSSTRPHSTQSTPPTKSPYTTKPRTPPPSNPHHTTKRPHTTTSSSHRFFSTVTTHSSKFVIPSLTIITIRGK